MWIRALVASGSDGALSSASRTGRRCRRLARDCTNDDVRDGLLRLAAEYIAEAAAQENGSEDGGAA
jgi:hypothetical protein